MGAAELHSSCVCSSMVVLIWSWLLDCEAILAVCFLDVLPCVCLCGKGKGMHASDLTVWHPLLSLSHIVATEM
jgi:hypothetical protein